MCSPGWKGRGKLAGAGWTRTSSEQTLEVSQRSNDPVLSQGRDLEGNSVAAQNEGAGGD